MTLKVRVAALAKLAAEQGKDAEDIGTALMIDRDRFHAPNAADVIRYALRYGHFTDEEVMGAIMGTFRETQGVWK